MNKHKMIWGVLVASLLGLFLGGCSKELGRGGNEEVPGLPEKGQAVTFTVTTGVETYAVPAQDYEKSISTLQALLFDASGRYVTSGTPAPTASGATSYTLPIATTGTYKMLLVANHTIPAGDLTGKTLSDVRAILVENEPGMPDAFVMASTNIPDFTVTAGAMTPAGTINLERLAARIDVQSTLDKLTLSKITVKNRKTQSSLLAASSTNAYRTDAKEYGSFERFRKPVTDASMGQIYAYENSAASASSADGTSLVIETAYNGYAVKPLEVKLPQLKRNYIYSIQLMMGDEGYVPDPSDNPDPSKIKLTYNVRVVDWNNGQTFIVSEEDLLKIFQKGAVSYAYNVQVTTTPDISSGVSADGGTVTINATATKQKLVGGTPDPTTPAETITGGDKFTYKVTNGPVDWLTISPAGVITIAANKGGTSRTATIEIALKEDNSVTKTVTVSQAGVDHSALKYNPLAYVAKWNVTSNGEWDEAHTIPESLYDSNVLMDWNTAMAKYGNEQSIQGSTETYKLPSREAWHGIVKYGSPQDFGSGDVQYNQTEQVEVAGQKFYASGDYKPTTMTVNGSSVKCNVALRFKGDHPTVKQYRSAWLYYWGTNAVNGKSVTGLWIYCINISGRQGISTVDHLDQKFWDQSLSSAVVRFFPATGIFNGNRGTFGNYWSATEYGSDSADTMFFNSSNVTTHGSYNKTYAFAVRLFASAPLD